MFIFAIESFIIKTISWLVLPFSLFITTWWGLASLKIFEILNINDTHIALFSGLSMVIGFALAIVVHNYIYINFYKFSYVYLAFVYFFFSAIGFAMLMGIPFFVIILGICTGIYSARRLSLNNQKDIKNTNIVKYFSSLITGFWILIMYLIARYDSLFYNAVEDYIGIKNIPAGFGEIVLVFLLVIFFMLIQYYLTNISFKLFYKVAAKLNA